ncbi:MAG: hypothetical protein KME55_37760 [Nostoc indistinguendum CM1-VF10]|jgi:hypothetical protein|nr:hypothetical protein [Nostoc indistinguendum CM1-VF10]
MEDIRIDDLDPVDAELFSDDENFMDELSEDELGLVAGGATPALPIVGVSTVSCAGAVSASVGAAVGAVGSLFD